MSKFDMGSIEGTLQAIAAATRATGLFTSISITMDGRPDDGTDRCENETPAEGDQLCEEHRHRRDELARELYEVFGLDVYDPKLFTPVPNAKVDEMARMPVMPATDEDKVDQVARGMRKEYGDRFEFVNARLDTLGEAIGAASAGAGAAFANGDPFKFQIGSEVVLETSRAAVEEQLRFEAEEKRNLESGQFDKLRPIATLRSWGGSIERGTVIARAEFSNRCNQYLLRYRAPDGQCEVWFDEDAIYQPEQELDVEAEAG